MIEPCLQIVFLFLRADEVEKNAQPPEPIHVNTDILHPSSDKRSFGSLTLENGLEVLVISDPDTTAAGAAVDVEVRTLWFSAVFSCCTYVSPPWRG